MSNSENKDPGEPKIIVDTDWKEQVAREKEASNRADSSSAEASTSQAEESPIVDISPDDDRADDRSVSDPGDRAHRELPPPPAASLDVLVSMLFTQAMAFLGQIPDPDSGAATVNKPYAKHYIDTLDMLSEKTKGNLSVDESKMMSEALHALRMMYVNVKA